MRYGLGMILLALIALTLSVGCAERRPDVIVHSPYPTVVVPPPPPPPPSVPIPHDIELPPVPFDDPRRVDMFNSSWRATATVTIDGTLTFTLGPRKWNPFDIRLDEGDHPVHVKWSVPTKRVKPGEPPVIEMLTGGEQRFPITITAHRRPFPIVLSEPG